MNTYLVNSVIMHAVNHYELESWDVLVECWSDEDIWSYIEEATSEKEAILLAAQALNAQALKK